MSLESWIEKRGRFVSGILDPIVRAQVIWQKVLPEVRARKRKAEEREQKYAARFDRVRWVADSDYAASASDYLLTAAAVFTFDVFIWIRTTLATMTGVPRLLATGFAFFVALVLGLMSHGASRMAFLHRHNMDETIRKHHRAAYVGGSITLAGGFWLLIVRYLPPEAVGPMLKWTWVPLLAMHFAGPATAGVLSSIGFLLIYPRWTQAQKNSAHEEATKLAEFEKRLEQLARDDEPDPNRPDDAPAGPGRTPVAAIVMLIGIWSWAGVAGSVHAGEQEACAALIDDSASLSAADRERAVEFVEDSLTEFLAAAECRWLVVGRFHEDGRWTKRDWLEVPKAAPADCSTAQPAPLSGPNAILKDYTNVQESRKDEVVALCERERQAWQKTSEQAWRAFHEAVHSRLGTANARSDVGTSIVELLESLAGSGIRVIVLITDGIDTREAIPALELPPDVTVILLLGAPDPRYASREAVLEAAKQWQRVGGQLSTILVSELRPDLWSVLLRKRTP